MTDDIEWACERGVNYHGLCIRGGASRCPKRTDTLRACQEQCLRHAGCNALVFNRYRMCYLKAETWFSRESSQQHGTVGCVRQLPRRAVPHFTVRLYAPDCTVNHGSEDAPLVVPLGSRVEVEVRGLSVENASLSIFGGSVVHQLKRSRPRGMCESTSKRETKSLQPRRWFRYTPPLPGLWLLEVHSPAPGSLAGSATSTSNISRVFKVTPMALSEQQRRGSCQASDSSLSAR